MEWVIDDEVGVVAVFYEEKRSKKGLKVRTKMPEEAGTGRVCNTLDLKNPRPTLLAAQVSSDPIAAADQPVQELFDYHTFHIATKSASLSGAPSMFRLLCPGFTTN